MIILDISIKNTFTLCFRTFVQLWLYDDLRMAVIEGSNSTVMKSFIQKNDTLELGGGAKVRIHQANLIVQLPMYADDETHQ